MTGFKEYMEENGYIGYDFDSCQAVTELFIRYEIDRLKRDESYAVVTIGALERALDSIEMMEEKTK